MIHVVCRVIGNTSNIHIKTIQSINEPKQREREEGRGRGEEGRELKPSTCWEMGGEKGGGWVNEPCINNIRVVQLAFG